jgi:hypothetical protein
MLQAAPGVETINFSVRKTLDQLHDLVPNGPDCSIEAVGFHYAHSLTHKVLSAIDLSMSDSAHGSCEISWVLWGRV